jgi:hypothetical protein
VDAQARAPQVVERVNRNGFVERLGTPDLYRATRLRALRLKRADLKFPPSRNPAEPFGVLVESGKHKATFLALADGTGSIYFTNGNGAMGGDEEFKQAARKLVAVAAQLPRTKPAPKDFPFPDADSIYCYLLTDSGVLFYGAAASVILSDRNQPEAKVYAAALDMDRVRGKGKPK